MKIRPFIILILIIILGSFLRFYLIKDIPPGLYPDEAMNGNNALEALATNKFKVFYPENNGREGLFINIQALSLKIFGNESWALRIVSSIFGTLTILGVYLLTKELFKKSQFPIPNSQSNFKELIFKRFKIRELKKILKIENWRIENYEIIALLSSFFLATSYWHINFSRIGFRAISVPFFATFGLYFLLKGLRQKSISGLTLAGVFIGLGFHTYIAFRFMPFIIAVPLGWYFWQWHIENQKSKFVSSTNSRASPVERQDIDVQLKNQNEISKSRNFISCTPCGIILFLFVTFIVALPIGYYFLQNPGDFLGRSGQVSIFSAQSPLKEFIKSTGLTLQMFFWQGDCNWRHNFNCKPELHPLIAFFFVVGFFIAVWNLKNWKLFKNWKLEIENLETPITNLTLLGWLIFMALPATLTREGLPHALRSIGMIPPVMILAALGTYWTLEKILSWLERKKEKWPHYTNQLQRIKREFSWLFVLMLLWPVPGIYGDYFNGWAENPNTYFAFSTDLLHLGKFLEKQPQDNKKYAMVNLPGVAVRGLPTPAQTIMFVTDTFREDSRREKNMIYITPENWENTLQILPGGKTLIAFLNGTDKKLIFKIQKKYPELKTKAPEDFVVLQNY